MDEATPPQWRALLALWVLVPPVLALQFLTAVPIPLVVPAAPRSLGRSMAFFPLVGALLGALLGGIDAVLRLALPLPAASAVLLAAAVLLTGGLHLDGLMDAADGVFGGRTVERRLEIMRDSRVGSFGVLAGALVLLVKYSALAALAPALRLPGLVVTLAAGRFVMAGATWAFPYARPQGVGAAFKAGVTWRMALVAALLALAVAGGALGWLGIGLLAAATAIAWALGTSFAAKLGGLTGDCYGALNEVVECALLLALVAVPGRLR